MNKSGIYIIIPVYNEVAVIAQTLHQLVQTEYNIVVVDDGSVDGSGEVIRKFRVHYICHPVNLGQGAALQTGMDFARMKDATAVVHFDADGQHRVSDIEQLLSPIINNDLDVVFGSRFLVKKGVSIPISKKIFLQLARYINWMFSGIMLTDAHNGLRALNSHALHKIYFSENRMAHASEILLLVKEHKLTFTEVPVTIEYTEYSRRKGQSLWNAVNIIFDLLFKKINR
ncbi:MAG TPA: glycosyltransferase family 2 protein [Chitinophagaceae bacterium]|nr:glycosyltransferase family 2 protein [Chitinophagaceae bacterium]